MNIIINGAGGRMGKALRAMLEKKGGCMEGRFESPLRTEKPWRLQR